MQLVDFDTWWSDFLAESRVRDAKDGGYAAVHELTRYIASLSPDLRAEFVNELAGIACRRFDGWAWAVGALEENWNPQVLARIASHVCSLKVSTDLDDQFAVSAFLRLLAKSADPDHRELLGEYLLVCPIGPYWSCVPWAAWPHDPDLFGRSWARYFSAKPAENWRDTAIVQAFLATPDALVCVRDALRGTDGTAWGSLRDAVLGQLDSQWLKENQRERVRCVCEGAG